MIVKSVERLLVWANTPVERPQDYWHWHARAQAQYDDLANQFTTFAAEVSSLLANYHVVERQLEQSNLNVGDLVGDATELRRKLSKAVDGQEQVVKRWEGLKAQYDALNKAHADLRSRMTKLLDKVSSVQRDANRDIAQTEATAEKGLQALREHVRHGQALLDEILVERDAAEDWHLYKSLALQSTASAADDFMSQSREAEARLKQQLIDNAAYLDALPKILMAEGLSERAALRQQAFGVSRLLDDQHHLEDILLSTITADTHARLINVSNETTIGHFELGPGGRRIEVENAPQMHPAGRNVRLALEGRPYPYRPSFSLNAIARKLAPYVGDEWKDQMQQLQMETAIHPKRLSDFEPERAKDPAANIAVEAKSGGAEYLRLSLITDAHGRLSNIESPTRQRFPYQGASPDDRRMQERQASEMALSDLRRVEVTPSRAENPPAEGGPKTQHWLSMVREGLASSGHRHPLESLTEEPLKAFRVIQACIHKYFEHLDAGLPPVGTAGDVTIPEGVYEAICAQIRQQSEQVVSMASFQADPSNDFGHPSI